MASASDKVSLGKRKRELQDTQAQLLTQLAPISAELDEIEQKEHDRKIEKKWKAIHAQHILFARQTEEANKQIVVMERIHELFPDHGIRARGKSVFVKAKDGTLVAIFNATDGKFQPDDEEDEAQEWTVFDRLLYKCNWYHRTDLRCQARCSWTAGASRCDHNRMRGDWCGTK